MRNDMNTDESHAQSANTNALRNLGEREVW